MLSLHTNSKIQIEIQATQNGQNILKKRKVGRHTFFSKCLFIYLAAWDHSCGMQDLGYSTWASVCGVQA